MIVEWEESALDRLADLYVAADPEERHAMARCVERINARLAIDPWEVGESRVPSQRVWFFHPLVVSFALMPGGTVLVYHVSKLK